jgi:hypothetical protein
MRHRKGWYGTGQNGINADGIRISCVAGELGFEPRLTESESAVLPLNYSPMVPQIAVKADPFKLDKSDV